ncbi:MAG: lipopolysaccharide biosynthesis protein, partial [Bacteroidetes bacterium]|nr:lipopolysaccharide biosynthesis protein [Bacteroidota bacterium]
MNDEISIRELIEKLQSIWKYLLSKWLLIGVVGLIGAGIGFFIAWSKPVKYTAKISFVAEEGKSSVGGLASLAGQFGFDLGGGSGGGIFAGENLLIFLKSEGLIRETLLTKFDSTSAATLADKYAEINEYKKGWVENKEIGVIDFSAF